MTEIKHYVREDGSYAGQYDIAPAGCHAIEWTPDDADQIWTGSAWASKPATLDELRAAKILAIIGKANALLSAGALVIGDLHVALDDGSRADLTAMAATATAAASGAVAWPDSYARGWISIENVRIPIPTPGDGLALAASVGNYYASIVQFRRDLKDVAIAAENAEVLDAIDVTIGWPG